MVANAQLVAQSSPADKLLEQLDDPKVAESLVVLLEHSDLIATLLVGLDGFVRRGDTIAEALADGVHELRSTAGQSPLAGVDVQGLVSSSVLLSGALVEGRKQAATSKTRPTGVFGLLRVLKDEDVSRGLNLLIEVARALGQKLA